MCEIFWPWIFKVNSQINIKLHAGKIFLVIQKREITTNCLYFKKKISVNSKLNQ